MIILIIIAEGNQVCDEGYYEDESTFLNPLNCIKCNFPCKECIKTPNDCLSCQVGKEMLLSHRTDKTVNYRCPCIPGYYEKNGGLQYTCEECNAICLACISENDCEYCNTQLKYQYIAVNKKCICQDGYYDIVTECLPCKEGCQKCTNPSDCQLCSKNYYGTNCSQQCAHDEYVDNEVCKRCSKICQECEQRADKCTACPQQTNRVDMSVTLNDCPCKLGYYEFQDDCVPCSIQCLHCEESQNNCVLCPPLSNRSPKPECMCLPGYFYEKDNPICQKCDISCKLCEQESKQCTECQDGYEMDIFDQISKKTNFYCKLVKRGCEFNQYQSYTICQQCQNRQEKELCKSCFQSKISQNDYQIYCIQCYTKNTFAPLCECNHPIFDFGCYKCNNKETLCQSTCDPNPLNCQVCEENKCIQCDESYQLSLKHNEEQFNEQCELPYQKESTLDNHAFTNYYEFNYLTTCPQSCLRCSKYQCLECFEGYILKGTICISQCPQSLIPKMNDCVPCPIGCLQCYHQYIYYTAINNYQPICEACDHGYKLVLGFCQILETCNQQLQQYQTPLMHSQSYLCIKNACNQFIPLLNKQSECIDCHTNYYLSKHECHQITSNKCSINCIKCVTEYKSYQYQYQCLECDELYHLYYNQFCFVSTLMGNDYLSNDSLKECPIQIPVGIDKESQCLECPIECKKCVFEYHATQQFMNNIFDNRKLICVDEEQIIDYTQVNGIQCNYYDIGCEKCMTDQLGIFLCLECSSNYYLHKEKICVVQEGVEKMCSLESTKNSMAIKSKIIGLSFCHILQDDCFESEIILINELDVENCLYCVKKDKPEQDDSDPTYSLNCTLLCPQYFYENQKSCNECGYGLTACFLDQMLTVIPNQCYPGYEYINEQCILKKQPSIILYNNYTLPIHDCPPQTFQVEGVCYNCPLNCYECNGPYYQHCTKCFKGYYQNQLDICAACKLGCQICLSNEECIQCVNGFKSINRFGYLECVKDIDSYFFQVIESYFILNINYLSSFLKIPREQIFQTIQHDQQDINEGDYLSSNGWLTATRHYFLTNLSIIYHVPMIGEKCYFPFKHFGQTCVISCPSQFYEYVNQFKRSFCYPISNQVLANQSPQLIQSEKAEKFKYQQCLPGLAKSYKLNTCIRCLSDGIDCLEKQQLYNYSFYRRNQQYIQDPFHSHNLAFNLHLQAPVNDGYWKLIKVIRDIIGSKEYLFHPTEQMRIVTNFYNNLNTHLNSLTIPFINLRPNCYYYLEYATYPIIIWTHNEGLTLPLLQNPFFNFSISDMQLLSDRTPYYLYVNILKFYHLLDFGYLKVHNEKSWAIIYPITRGFQSFMVNTPDFCLQGQISFSIVLRMVNKEVYTHTIRTKIQDKKNKLLGFYQLINHPVLVKKDNIRNFELLEYSGLLGEFVDQFTNVDWDVKARFDCKKNGIEECSSQGQCLQNQFMMKCQCYNQRQGYKCQYSKRQYIELKKQIYYLIGKMKEKKDIKGDYLSYMHALKVFTLSDVIDLSDNKNQNYIYKQISDMMQFNQILKSDQILEKDELDVYMDVLNNLIRLLDYNIDSLSKIKIRPEIENEILYQIQYVGLHAFKILPPSVGYIDYQKPAISMKYVKIYTKELTDDIVSIKLQLSCNLGEDIRMDQDKYIEFVEIEIPNINQLIPKTEDIILFKIGLIRSYFLKNRYQKDLFIPQLVFIQAYDYHNMQKILTNYSDENGVHAKRIRITMKLPTNIVLNKRVYEKQCYLYYQSQVDYGVWLEPLNCIFRSYENEELTCECINYGFVGVYDQNYIQEVEELLIKKEYKQNIKEDRNIKMIPIFDNITDTDANNTTLLQFMLILLLMIVI